MQLFGLLLFAFLFEIDAEIVQRSSSDVNVLGESITQRSTDRPWMNMTNGLVCESNQKASCNLWSFSYSQMLKTSNFNFTFPPEYPIVVRGVYVSWTVSINRKPYLGVRESKVVLFLPNTTVEIPTKVKVYPTTVGEDGWQVQETTLMYPLANESSLWGRTNGIDVTELSSPSFGFGLTILNGQTDTRAMIGCVLVTVIYDQILPTTTTEFVETTTPEPTTEVQSTTLAPTTTKKTAKSTTPKKTTVRTTTTVPQKIIDETSGNGQAIISLIVVIVVGLCCFFGVGFFVHKQHKKWKAKMERTKKTSKEYQQLTELSLNEIQTVRKNSMLTNVEINEQIGAGSTGVVYLGKIDNGTTKVACKVYYNQFQEYIREETKAMFSLKHVNLVQLMGMYEDAKLKLVVVMEYCYRGSLVDFFSTADMKKWYCTQQELNNRSICLCAAKAMSYLANKDIVHGNLSPTNVLIELKDDTVIAKLTDFWMGKYLSMPSSGLTITKSESKRLTVVPMANEYPIAPEITSYSTGQYSKRSDIYSYGYLIHYVYVMGDVPESKADKELAMKGKSPNMPLNSGVFDFQQRCCDKEPRDRPDAINAVEFFHKLYEQLERIELEDDDDDFHGKEEEENKLINEMKEKQSMLNKSSSSMNYRKFTDV